MEVIGQHTFKGHSAIQRTSKWRGLETLETLKIATDWPTKKFLMHWFHFFRRQFLRAQMISFSRDNSIRWKCEGRCGVCELSTQNVLEKPLSLSRLPPLVSSLHPPAPFLSLLALLFFTFLHCFFFFNVHSIHYHFLKIMLDIILKTSFWKYETLVNF